MNTGRRAIQEVAKRSGVSEATVRREIEAVITAARKNPDPLVRARWRRVPCAGRYPTPEELIEYLSRQAEPGKSMLLAP